MAKKMKNVRAKLIANPGSGQSSDRGKLLQEVTRRLKELGIKVDVAVAKPKEEAIPIARRAAKDGYKLVIGMGGDDTIEAIIRGLAGTKTALGIIPVGTANNLAKALGIPEDAVLACDLIAAGNVRKLDLGFAKTKKCKSFPFFELVTVGIAAAIYPSAVKASKGRLDKIKDVLETALTHESKPKITVIMDDESNVTVETMLAMVSNVPLIGPNMLVDPDASMEDGLLDVSLYPSFSKAELITYFGRTMNENRVDDGKIQHYRAREMKIKASPKLEVMADGVMLGKGTVKIKLRPGALRVVAPEPGAGLEAPPQKAGADLPAPVAPVAESNGKSANGKTAKSKSGAVQVMDESAAAH